MPFQPKPGEFHRMPVFFGPMHGPRFWPADVTINPLTTSRRTSLGVNLLTDQAALDAVLPDGFEVWGDPVVTVETTWITDIGWLAGRGYNLCDVRIPAVYASRSGPVHGTLVLIRWENLADPIISGREELGHNKLYCEIPPMRSLNGTHDVQLSWLAHPFLRLSIQDLTDQPIAEPNPLNQGTLSYKYIPKTGAWGEADVAYATLTPPTPDVRALSRQTGTGSVEFLPTTWRDLPTQSYVIEALRAWPIREYRGAHLSTGVGVADTEGTRILEQKS